MVIVAVMLLARTEPGPVEVTYKDLEGKLDSEFQQVKAVHNRDFILMNQRIDDLEKEIAELKRGR